MLKEFGEINGNLLKDTFEMLTLSKMRYCGEFCFDDNIRSLNKVQYQFYKRFCHLKITTPHYCLVGEFGIKPMEFHFYKAAIRYWMKILTLDSDNLIKKVYDEIYDNMGNPFYSRTWCSRIKDLMYKLRLEELWINQHKIEKNIYKKSIDIRLTEYFREEWINSAKHSRKGLNYLELSRFNCKLKPYLNFIANDKSVEDMLKIRTGNHSLSTEIDRYRNRKNL